MQRPLFFIFSIALGAILLGAGLGGYVTYHLKNQATAVMLLKIMANEAYFDALAMKNISENNIKNASKVLCIQLDGWPSFYSSMKLNAADGPIPMSILEKIPPVSEQLLSAEDFNRKIVEALKYCSQSSPSG